MSDWPTQVGWLVASVIIGSAVLLTTLFLWGRVRRESATLDGVKIEVHGVYPVDDLVVEIIWRAIISMTNRSRKPRRLPVLASRATVTAGRKQYLAGVFLESNTVELSPDDVAIAWVETALPAGEIPRSLALAELHPCGAPRQLRLRIVPQSTINAPQVTPR